MKHWLHWHRCFGLLASIALIAWSLSGILHTAMMRLQPRAAMMTPPAQSVSLAQAMPLKTVLRKNHVGTFMNAHMVAIDGRLYYQVEQKGLLYFDARTGTLDKNGSIRHAELLARHYTGDGRSKIKSIQFITRFDEDYVFINRLLPVYRVDFDRPDGLRAYVELTGGCLGTIVDRTKIVMGRLFQLIHTWSFLNAFPYLKLAMLVFLVAGFLTGLSGLYLYFRFNKIPFRRPLRNYHRRLGLLVSAVILAWTSTGVCHLLKTLFPSEALVLPRQTMTADELPSHMAALPPNFRNFRLLKHQGHLLYRVELTPGQTVFHSHDAETGPQSRRQLPKATVAYVTAEPGRSFKFGDDDYAKSLAGLYSGLPDISIKSRTLVSNFNDEYGFIFKRLPVYRIEYDTPSGDVYFVDPSTGALAAHMADADRLEGVLFAYLHKWAFLGKNQDFRDGLLVLFALANILVALSGVWLWVQPKGILKKR